MNRVQFPLRSVLPQLASISLLVACSGSVEDPNTMLPGAPGPASSVPGGGPAGSAGPAAGATGGAATPGVGAPAGSGTAGAVPGATPAVPGEPGDPAVPGATPADPGATPCIGEDTAASKRIVRLSFNQIANSIGTLLEPSLSAELVDTNDVLDSKNRAFPPLQSPREGNAITDGQWTTVDAMASEGAQYVFDNFEAVTGCGAQPTDACAQEYLAEFAEKAYRRPLTADEQTRVTALYAELTGEIGATINEAVQHGVYAILQAPQFVYRTELGADLTVDGAMTQHELASALSYFLTDDMPDQTLLDAAAANQLTTPDAIGAQVERILGTDAAKRNLQDAMFSYFNFQGIQNIIIADLTDGVKASMIHEGELFLENTLWNGSLNDLLLSRQSVINEGLAEIYGIAPFPQPGTTPDADGFAPVELPENRAGIATMPGFLSSRSKPEGTSVVGRGLLIKNAFLCTDTPPPPANIAETLAALEEEAPPDQTERDKAQYRAEAAECAGCHTTFDPYGLALENYDIVGRWRTEYDEFNPPIAIDASVTLPEQIGGGMAANMTDVVQQITSSEAFAKCMGRNLLNYALADTSAGSAQITSCSTQRVADAYAAEPEKTFSSLVKSVAVSAAFSNRSQGGAAQ